MFHDSGGRLAVPERRNAPAHGPAIQDQIDAGENLRGVQAGWDGRDFSWSRNGETIVTIENMMDLIDNRSLRLAQGGFTIA